MNISFFFHATKPPNPRGTRGDHAGISSLITTELLLHRQQKFYGFVWFDRDRHTGVVPCGGRKTSPRTSTIVQFIFYFGALRSAIIF